MPNQASPEEIRLAKKVHAALRAAGYTRVRHDWHIAIEKHYRSYIKPATSILIVIPGPWSLTRREQIKLALMAALEKFQPSPLLWQTGVEVYLDRNR